MEWLGIAKVDFIHSPTPLKLQKKDGSSTDLSKICEEATPPCHLNPLLLNGHLQTMWTAVKSEGPPIYYKRKEFTAQDPDFKGTYAVDFVSDKFLETDDTLPSRTTFYSEKEFNEIGSLDSRPMLVALHGLSGGSHEVYLRHVLAPLVEAEGDRKWEACVVNARGCANHKISSSVLFNARATWDCRETVKWLRKIFPNRQLYGIGFSLGANILTNYVGEEGSSCPLKAAVVISSPWNLEIGNVMLQSTFLGQQVYSKAMATNMKALAELHHEEISKIEGINWERIRACNFLHEFDRELQGPTWGYPTEGAYYRDASSVDALLEARIPVFIINATDDPIAASAALPYREVLQTPYAVLCTTSLGGHLSWFEFGGSRWHARPAANFLNKMAFEIDEDATIKSTDNGFVQVDGKPHKFQPLRRKWQVSE